ncbi:hypothetical protein EJ05DRAFT_291209 [Pseudovirgaria hyperparasitica]|uniref:Uncharacterized protein n=1 Tax=Pseudovirgaria hyperparasitica TaxID=470096 RepID=A0A6A6WHJ5_9PEZI|nr:uncharacterized protein EJ05DRAFT_291209 [Pseudovirgaria hyperparasitica]KAF2760621.1 hypothetical protein EJ05DRAFT_291209 [Pseudovirgaria hyperparasitica]
MDNGPLQINGRWMNDFPRQYACEHLRQTKRCDSGICFANYEGFGPRRCSNTHCRGHRSKDDPQCLGGPPVMRCCDILAVKERRQRARMKAELRALEQDSVPGDYRDWGPSTGGQFHVPRSFHQDNSRTTPEPSNTENEAEILRRVMELSIQEGLQQPKPPVLDKDLADAILASQQEPQSTPKPSDTFDDDLEEAIRASQQEPHRVPPAITAFDEDLQAAIRASQQEPSSAPSSSHTFDNDLAEAIRASRQEPQRASQVRDNFDREFEEAIRRSQNGTQWAAPSRPVPAAVIATPTVRSPTHTLISPPILHSRPSMPMPAPAPAPALTLQPPPLIHADTAPAIVWSGERDPDAQKRERVSIDQRTVSPVHHADWQKWSATEGKKWDAKLAHQDSNAATGEAPPYTPWAQNGEKTAEFDAATDEVSRWEDGFDAQA